MQCVIINNQDILKTKKWLSYYYQGILSNSGTKALLNKVPLSANV